MLVGKTIVGEVFVNVQTCFVVVGELALANLPSANGAEKREGVSKYGMEQRA